MRERLLADWPLKALAFVVAFAIWISITGQDRTLRDVVVPLKIDFGPDRIAERAPPTAVKVRLEGPRSSVRKVDPLRLAVRLDLREAPLGRREIPLTTNDLTEVPRGIEVSMFDPDRLQLVLARRVRRELEIAPELVGRPAEGYVVYGAVVDPASVVVAGPQAAVDVMSSLRTEAIPLDDHTATFVASVALVPEDPLVRVVDFEDVEVQILVDAAPVQATFDDVRVELPFLPAGTARLRPATVRVRLSGPPWLIERMQPTQIAGVADVEPPGFRGSERVPVRVELRLPEDRRRLITVESVHPTHVTVEIGSSG